MEVYFLVMGAIKHKNLFLKTFNSRVSHHIYFWGLLFALMILEDPTDPEHYRYAFVYLFKGIPPVYTHFYFFEKYFYNRKFIPYIISFIMIVIIFGFIGNLATVHFFLEDDAEKKPALFGDILTVTFYILITSALKMAKRTIKHEFQLQEIRSKQTRTELDLLKSQINPHFLFNTLNNLFSMARSDKDSRTADGIAKLAHILRYMLYESNVEKIDLEREIEQINSYIELQKLRFSRDDDINIEFKTEGPIEAVKIPPMLLMPFVENAFKHSITLQTPTTVNIGISITENILIFSADNTINKTRQDKEDDHPGIGLSNIRRRLELLYPESHELNITDNGDKFNVRLTLDLKC